MLVHKNIGEVCLNQGQLQRALENYSFGLELAGLFPTESNFQEEAAKILCNRSLVLLRMEIHNDAERDAAIAIQTRPTFIKVCSKYQELPKVFKTDHHPLPYNINF